MSRRAFDPSAGGRSRPERRHVEDLADEITELAAVLRVDVPDLDVRARSYADSGDGYPTSSLGGGVASGHGDPVGNLVAHRATGTEPVRSAYLRATSKLMEAARALREARSTVDATRPRVRVVLDEGCVSHARIGVVEPPRARGRCRWCSDHRQPDGSDPPLDKLRALEEYRDRASRKHRPAP